MPDSRTHGEEGLFLSGYQVVLGVKAVRADPRGHRQTLDASAATWTGPPQA